MTSHDIDIPNKVKVGQRGVTAAAFGHPEQLVPRGCCWLLLPAAACLHCSWLAWWRGAQWSRVVSGCELGVASRGVRVMGGAVGGAWLPPYTCAAVQGGYSCKAHVTLMLRKHTAP